MNNIKIHKKSVSLFCTSKDEVRMVKHGPPAFCVHVTQHGQVLRNTKFCQFIMQPGTGNITRCNNRPLQTDVQKLVVSVYPSGNMNKSCC